MGNFYGHLAIFSGHTDRERGSVQHEPKRNVKYREKYTEKNYLGTVKRFGEKIKI